MPALHWPDEEFAAFTQVRKEMFQRVENNTDAVLACEPSVPM
jgi:hypothetical protein